MYHSQTITLRLPPQTVETIDAVRGGIPRSAFIRGVLDGYLEDLGVQPVDTTTTEQGPPPSRGTPPRPPLTVVVGDEKRHLHRYQRTGEPIRHDKGAAIYTHICECGATKEDR